MSQRKAEEDPVRLFYVYKCNFALKRDKCLVSLGDYTQQGPDPAFVRNPDRLDYLLHDHNVLVLAPNHFHPDRSLIFCPECQRSDFVTTDGWEPA